MLCGICRKKGNRESPLSPFDYYYCSCDRWEEKEYWEDKLCMSCAREKYVCRRCGEDVVKMW